MDDVVQVVTMIDAEDGARTLAHEAVAARLAACGQVDGPVSSSYWWDGAVTTDTEWRVTFKTTAAMAPELERWLTEHHPYDVPEVLRVPVLGGNPDYLAWVAAEAG
ncbi:divalent-cation tolerance protein CutA [Isoptericola croceus]|uniref:divalent-cation tolerance protein CutA n=1 Tax=Isoptericola croceus TaxID=3031406 RepID=UPI0023F9732A|nr:divalent-cation tolerance protein CutA [Isoptericola croceus]